MNNRQGKFAALSALMTLLLPAIARADMVWPALLGAFLLLVAGLLWEIGPDLLLFKFFNIGTFNPGTWAFTLIIAVVITTYIEYLIAKRLLKGSPPEPLFKVVLIANILSVSLAFGSLFVFRPNI
jgi:hypothetical protein